MAFFKLVSMSLALRFTQQDFIERRCVIKTRVIRDRIVIIALKMAIGVRELVANIIDRGTLIVLNTVFNKLSKTK